MGNISYLEQITPLQHLKKSSHMQIESTAIPDVKLITPKVFKDSRGYFFESFKDSLSPSDRLFVQENESKSSKGVLRGLHYQIAPYAQAKLVRVIQGAVLDVAVDIRPGSPTFGQHVAYELSDENFRQLYIPRGFAHGFLVLSDIARVSYKCTDYYFPKGDRSIIWSDKDINISWPDIGMKYIISEKDSKAKLLSESETSE